MYKAAERAGVCHMTAFTYRFVRALILAMLWHNPRLLLQDYPKDVRASVPPKTPAEKQQSTYWAAVFLLLLMAFPMLAVSRKSRPSRLSRRLPQCIWSWLPV